MGEGKLELCQVYPADIFRQTPSYSFFYRLYMAGVLPIWHETQENQQISLFLFLLIEYC